MTALSIGILGAARITPKALIFPANVIPQASVICMAARDRERAQAAATEWGVETVHAAYEDVINDPAVDLVYNPLPINLHADWTIKALNAGKHVLCEKLFAMNAGEARAMLDAAEQSGKRLIEAFHYRYHPTFQTCMDWLHSGVIGEVREVEAVFNIGIKDDGREIRHRVETGGGAMMDLGCYPLHWALNVLDEAPRSIEAMVNLTPTGVDEAMVAQVEFESGAVAKLKASMVEGEPFKSEMHITGSEGNIVFRNPLAPHMGAELCMSWQNGQKIARDLSHISTYTYQLEALIDGIQSGTPLPTEGDMILRQQDALDAIYEAAGLKHLRYLEA